MRDILQQLEGGAEADLVPVLAYLGGLQVDLGDELPGAVRRAVLLLAAGGDPHRELELDGRAVTGLAEELDDPGRREALAVELRALRSQATGLPGVERALARLIADGELAWRAFAAGLLASDLAGDEDG